MSKKEISPTRSPNPTRDELREEVRGVLESFLTSEIRRREKISRQESSDVEFRSGLRPSSFTPDLRKTSTQISPSTTSKLPSVISAGLSPGFHGNSDQTSIEPWSGSSGMHGNITASTFGTGPTALDSAQLNLVNEGEMPPLPTGLQPKKSFYKRAKQRVQESFRRHNGSKKIPLVKSYSSQPTDGSVASDYELLNRSLPMPRKVLSGSISPNTRSLDYKKLSSVRPVVNGGNDSWIKNCFIPSGIQTDQNDRTSSYEKTTLTDVPFAYKGKKVRNKKLRTKKWYNNLLSRIVDRSTTDNKMKKKKAKSIDTTDNRLAQLLPRKFRFNKRREINVIAKSEGLQVNEVDSQAFRPSAHHRVTKGIADLSAEAQTGLQSVTKQISRETKILHRTSGDFHHLGAASAEIYIQSPSSPSSKDSSIALLQLDTSRVKLIDPLIDEIKELQVSPPAPEFNDTLNLSSTTDDVISPILNDQTTEMFDAIADRLATIGDQCLSAIPVQSGLGSEELTDVERELVAWVRRSGDRIDDRIPPVVMDALLRDGLRHIINRFTTEVPMVGQLYLAFRLTSVVVNGGVNSNAVRQVKDNCVNFIADRFASWIVGHGGWLSAVEDSTTTDTDG